MATMSNTAKIVGIVHLRTPIFSFCLYVSLLFFFFYCYCVHTRSSKENVRDMIVKRKGRKKKREVLHTVIFCGAFLLSLALVVKSWKKKNGMS
jgi:hypothetical protein